MKKERRILLTTLTTASAIGGILSYSYVSIHSRINNKIYAHSNHLAATQTEIAPKDTTNNIVKYDIKSTDIFQFPNFVSTENIFPDYSGKYWALTQNGSIIHFDPNHLSDYKTINLASHSDDVNAKISGGLTLDVGGSIWASLESETIFQRINKNTEKGTYYVKIVNARPMSKLFYHGYGMWSVTIEKAGTSTNMIFSHYNFEASGAPRKHLQLDIKNVNSVAMLPTGELIVIDATGTIHKISTTSDNKVGKLQLESGDEVENIGFSENRILFSTRQGMIGTMNIDGTGLIAKHPFSNPIFGKIFASKYGIIVPIKENGKTSIYLLDKNLNIVGSKQNFADESAGEIVGKEATADNRLLILTRNGKLSYLDISIDNSHQINEGAEFNINEQWTPISKLSYIGDFAQNKLDAIKLHADKIKYYKNLIVKFSVLLSAFNTYFFTTPSVSSESSRTYHFLGSSRIRDKYLKTYLKLFEDEQKNLSWQLAQFSNSYAYFTKNIPGFEKPEFTKEFQPIYKQMQKNFTDAKEFFKNMKIVRTQVDKILKGAALYDVEFLNKYNEDARAKNLEDSFRIWSEDKVLEDPSEYSDYFGSINIGYLRGFQKYERDNHMTGGSSTVATLMDDKTLQWYYLRLTKGKYVKSPLMQKIYDSIHFTYLGDKLGYVVNYKSKITENISIFLRPTNEHGDTKNSNYASPENISKWGVIAGMGNPKNAVADFVVVAKNGFRFKHKNADGTFSYTDKIVIKKIVDKDDIPYPAKSPIFSFEKYLYGENLRKLIEAVDINALSIKSQPFANEQVNIKLISEDKTAPNEKEPAHLIEFSKNIKGSPLTYRYKINVNWFKEFNRNPYTRKLADYSGLPEHLHEYINLVNAELDMPYIVPEGGPKEEYLDYEKDPLELAKVIQQYLLVQYHAQWKVMVWIDNKGYLHINMDDPDNPFGLFFSIAMDVINVGMAALPVLGEAWEAFQLGSLSLDALGTTLVEGAAAVETAIAETPALATNLEAAGVETAASGILNWIGDADEAVLEGWGPAAKNSLLFADNPLINGAEALAEGGAEALEEGLGEEITHAANIVAANNQPELIAELAALDLGEGAVGGAEYPIQQIERILAEPIVDIYGEGAVGGVAIGEGEQVTAASMSNVFGDTLKKTSFYVFEDQHTAIFNGVMRSIRAGENIASESVINNIVDAVVEEIGGVALARVVEATSITEEELQTFERYLRLVVRETLDNINSLAANNIINLSTIANGVEFETTKLQEIINTTAVNALNGVEMPLSEVVRSGAMRAILEGDFIPPEIAEGSISGSSVLSSNSEDLMDQLREMNNWRDDFDDSSADEGFFEIANYDDEAFHDEMTIPFYETADEMRNITEQTILHMRNYLQGLANQAGRITIFEVLQVGRARMNQIIANFLSTLDSATVDKSAISNFMYKAGDTFIIRWGFALERQESDIESISVSETVTWLEQHGFGTHDLLMDAILNDLYSEYFDLNAIV